MPLPKLLANLSTRGRIAVGGAAVGVLVVLYIMFSLATKPSYTTIVTALDPAQTGKMTAALDEKGVGYELQNNGTALAVQKADVANARIALAEVGGVSGGKIQPGFELFDEQSMGTSQMQQRVTYQRAMEGELANTIRQIQGVGSASVQLVLPDDNDALFTEDAPQPSAAVLLGAADIDPSAVQGIARLVASSVKSLRPQNVTITDAAGQLLWPNGAAGDAAGGTGATLAKQSAAQKYQRTMETSLTTLLAQTVGPDKARVRVSADIDADKATQEQLRYGRRSVPLKEKTSTEQMRGTGGAGGASNSASTVPGYAAGGAGGGGNSRYSNETTDRELGNDKTVEKREIAAGGVQKQSVAVMVSDKVPQAQIPAIQSAVAAAAGIDRQRGDQLTVTRVPFAAPPAPAAGPMVPGGILAAVKWALLGLATIVFLVLVGRHLRRREGEPLASAAWLDELEPPRPIRALHAEQPTAQLAAVGVPPLAEYQAPVARRQIEELAEREPEKVAHQVRHWMGED